MTRQTISTFAAVAIAAFSISTSQAAPPADCVQQDSGDRLKCKFQNIIEQQEESATKLSSMGNIPADRTDKLMRQVGNTMSTNSRTGPSDFKQLTKKGQAQCDIVELLNHAQSNGDGDGICTGNEMCEEDNDDQIGNNDSVCMPKNGKKREACLQICDAEAIRGNPNNFDDSPGSRGADFEKVLDDITDDYVELNNNLGQSVAIMASFAAQASSDSCGAVLNARPTDKQLDNSFMAAYIAENLAEQADNICNLDAAGFNVAVACIVTDGIFIVAKGIADTITSANETVDSQTIDATLACVKDLQAAAGDQAAQLDAIDAKLNTTLEMLNETIELLITPQGQRDGFPNK